MKSFNVKFYRLTALIFFFLIVVFFAWTFALAPFPEIVNLLILNGATIFSALIAALILTLTPF